MLKCWIEAMRLRTLPVSVAGVIAAVGYAVAAGRYRLLPSVLCLTFAVLAQVASNFANEYYDYRDGLDRPGRIGPRRGVTEGDITPRAMLRAVALTLGTACLTGLTLLVWGPWWLVIVGVAIAAGVLAYSAGPYPLSRHGLGEVAVIFFFGIIPVNFTYLLATGQAPDAAVVAGSVAIGLMGANVLIVNNYRDREEDMAVGKRTLAVIIGARGASTLYLINGYVAVVLLVPTWSPMPEWAWVVPAVYASVHTALWHALTTRRGQALNPLLGMTSVNMLVYSLLWIATAVACGR